MIQVLYKAMAVPETCQLAKRVFKKLFHENAKLSVTDKKAFREDIDTITWQYTLKSGTIPIQPYEDDHREYHEVAVLQVDLKTLKRTGRIAEIIHRAIPYPVVTVFVFKGYCALSLAHKRFSQAERGQIVAEDILLTPWIDLKAPTLIQQDFIESLKTSDLPHTHFYAFYSALMDRLIALKCARLTGEFHLDGGGQKPEERLKRLSACHQLETQIAENRAAIKVATQFNRQVELNMKIKELEKRLQQESAIL